MTVVQALDKAYRAASAWIDGLDTRSVAATATLDDLKQHFSGPLPIDRTKPEDVVQMLVDKASAGLLGSASGRFFAWVMGGGLEISARRRVARCDVGPERCALRL